MYIHDLCRLLHSEHMHTNVRTTIICVSTIVVDQNKSDLCEPNDLPSTTYKNYMYVYICMYAVANLERQEHAYF